MKEIIERLRKEKFESDEEFYERGKEDGFSWCEYADYHAIQSIIQWDAKSVTDDVSVHEVIDDTMEYMEGLDFNFAECDENPFNDYARIYFEGFVEGARDFWVIFINES